MTSTLDGNVAIVTGSSAGIGRETALQLAAAGANVVLAARRKERLDTLAAEINDSGTGKALAVVTDVTDDTQLEHLVAETRAAFGQVDILVNNAGYGAIAAVHQLDLDQLDAIMRINFRAVVALSKLVLPEMVARRSGAIVNLGSVSSKKGWAGGTPYVTSKFALRGFTQCLAEEARPYGVRVVGIYPDIVSSEFFEAAGSALAGADRAIPPADVASAILAALQMDPRTNVTEIELAPTTMNPAP